MKRENREEEKKPITTSTEGTLKCVLSLFVGWLGGRPGNPCT